MSRSARQAATLCRLAGADRALIPEWAAEGRLRALGCLPAGQPASHWQTGNVTGAAYRVSTGGLEA